MAASELLQLVHRPADDRVLDPDNRSPGSADATGPAARRSWRGWRVWLGLVVSAVVLALAFRGQNLSEVGDALRQVDWIWLAPAIALYFAGVWVRAVRWSVLLRPIVAVRPGEVVGTVLVGFAANNVLPLRTGEVVRAFLLGRRHGVRKTATLATIAVERLFDGLTMLAFMIVAGGAISLTAELRHIALIGVIAFAALLAGLIGFVASDRLRERVLRLAVGPLPAGISVRVERMAESFLEGLGVLTQRRALATVAATSVVAWVCEASMYWTIARGFAAPLPEAIDPAGALLTTGVANLATLIPAAPGYVGTFEAGVALAVVGALDVPRGLALSYALVVHAALWLPVTIVGAIEWWRSHLSLDQARRVDDAVVSPPTGSAPAQLTPPVRTAKRRPAAGR